jgi:hypothetical protein
LKCHDESLWSSRKRRGTYIEKQSGKEEDHILLPWLRPPKGYRKNRVKVQTKKVIEIVKTEL